MYELFTQATLNVLSICTTNPNFSIFSLIDPYMSILCCLTPYSLRNNLSSSIYTIQSERESRTLNLKSKPILIICHYVKDLCTSLSLLKTHLTMTLHSIDYLCHQNTNLNNAHMLIDDLHRYFFKR